jgi:DNA polymerase-4
MPDSQPRKIIHIDMDAFYASVEQRDDRKIRGRPVAVGHAAKRGVVAAASYEARAFGIRSAMPATTAMRLCPELVFVPPRFEVYRAVSRQIQGIFADYTLLIEPLSLDEAYLDVSTNLRGLPTASATAMEIRARILDETGLTASAGISYNKFLAKLASDYRKPNGQFVVRPGFGAAFVEALPVSKFHGVGPVTAARMQRLGIETGADLRAKPLEFCSSISGNRPAGISVSPTVRMIAQSWPIGRENHQARRQRSNGTLRRRKRSRPSAGDGDDVWSWCEKAQAFGRTVTVKVKFADFAR